MVYKSSLLKKLFLTLFLSAVLLFLLYTAQLDKTASGFKSGVVPNLSAVPLVSSNIPFVQKFNIRENDLSRLDILISTYGRENNSNIEIELSDGKTSVFKKRFDAKQLKDNSYMKLEFEKLSSKNKDFMLTIRSDNSDPGKAIAVWETQDGELRFIPYVKISGAAYLNQLFERISLNNLPLINLYTLHALLFFLVYIISFINISFIGLIYENIADGHRKR